MNKDSISILAELQLKAADLFLRTGDPWTHPVKSQRLVISHQRQRVLAHRGFSFFTPPNRTARPAYCDLSAGRDLRGGGGGRKWRVRDLSRRPALVLYSGRAFLDTALIYVRVKGCGIDQRASEFPTSALITNHSLTFAKTYLALVAHSRKMLLGATGASACICLFCCHAWLTSKYSNYRICHVDVRLHGMRTAFYKTNTLSILAQRHAVIIIAYSQLWYATQLINLQIYHEKYKWTMRRWLYLVCPTLLVNFYWLEIVSRHKFLLWAGRLIDFLGLVTGIS